MKKLISLLMVFAVLISLCACGAGNAQGSEPAQDPGDATADATGEAAAGNQQDNINLEEINELEPNEKGVYQIVSLEGLKNIANHPEASFALLCDIDLGGAQWVPVGAPFTGSIDGRGFKVSNFVIDEASNDGNMGFVAVNEGSIQNLVLEAVSVITDETTKNVGAFAGTNLGQILQCEAYGTIHADALAEGGACGGAAGVSEKTLEQVKSNVDIVCNADGAASIGGAVGAQNGGKLLFCSIGGDLDVADEQDKNIGLLAGYATDAQVEDNSYIGESATAGGTTVTATFGLQRTLTAQNNVTRDISYTVSYPADVQARRDKVIELAYEMATVEWRVPEYMEYKNACSCCDVRTFRTGKLYKGIPYNHNNGSMQRFYYAMDKQTDGSYIVSDWARQLTSHDGYDTWDMYIGNDCCSAMMQLYACVSNNCNIKRSVNQFPWFDENYEANAEETYPLTASGAIPVGGWVWDAEELKLDEDHYTAGGKKYIDYNIEKVAPENPKNVNKMLEAYASIQPADLLSNIISDGSGHSQIVVENIVTRDANGYLDPAKSKVVTIQQVQGFYEYSTYMSSWKVETEYTYNQLLEEFYLPATFIELIESNNETPTAKLEGAQQGRLAMTSGTVKSNFYLDSVQLIVKDSSGKEVLNERMFVTVDKNTDAWSNTWTVRSLVKEFDMAHFTSAVSEVQWDTSKSYSAEIKAHLTTAMFDNVISVTKFSF